MWKQAQPAYAAAALPGLSAPRPTPCGVSAPQCPPTPTLVSRRVSAGQAVRQAAPTVHVAAPGQPAAGAAASSAGMSFQGGAARVQQLAAPVGRPVFVTLECIYAERVSLAGFSKERRSLVHCGEFGTAPLPTCRVGQMFQQALFHNLVPEEEDRKVIAREHFQIWAEEMPSPSKPSQLTALAEGFLSGQAASRRLCSFFLTNYSNSGTIVNGVMLGSGGEQVPLHGGDTIALARHSAHDGVPVPFIEFRFDLTGSILGDAFAGRLLGGSAPIAASAPPLAPCCLADGARSSDAASRTQCKEATVAASPSSSPASTARAVPSPSLSRTSSVEGAEIGGAQCTSTRPLFALEVGGSGVVAGAAARDRRIVHAPGTTAGPALLLGRTQQPGFWERLLTPEAFSAMSRKHLQIEVQVKASSTSACLVRNLSDMNPIRICRSADPKAIEAEAPLKRGEARPLQDGDVVVLIPDQGTTLWLLFLDLSVQSPCGSLLVAPTALRKSDATRVAARALKVGGNPQQPQ